MSKDKKFIPPQTSFQVGDLVRVPKYEADRIFRVARVTPMGPWQSLELVDEETGRSRIQNQLGVEYAD